MLIPKLNKYCVVWECVVCGGVLCGGQDTAGQAQLCAVSRRARRWCALSLAALSSERCAALGGHTPAQPRPCRPAL